MRAVTRVGPRRMLKWVKGKQRAKKVLSAILFDAFAGIDLEEQALVDERCSDPVRARCRAKHMREESDGETDPSGVY